MNESEKKPTRRGSDLAGLLTQNTDSIVQDASHGVKRFADLQARAVTQGRTLQRIGSGYLLSRWGDVLHCTSLEAVELRLRQLAHQNQKTSTPA